MPELNPGPTKVWLFAASVLTTFTLSPTCTVTVDGENLLPVTAEICVTNPDAGTLALGSEGLGTEGTGAEEPEEPDEQALSRTNAAAALARGFTSRG